LTQHAGQGQTRGDKKQAGRAGETSGTAGIDRRNVLPMLPTPVQFGNFSAADNGASRRDTGGDFAARIDAQQLLPGMLQGEVHGAVAPASAAQLDLWCRQLAGPWPANEQVRIELPLPGLGPVDLALEHQATQLHVSVDAGNDAARRWFEQQRRQIEARLQHYTGKTVRVDFTHSPLPSRHD
jgi:hypothetical protein